VASHPRLQITGMGALSALGTDLAAHLEAVRGKRVPFRPLGGLLGPASPHARRPGAWIEPRALLTHRKWSPVTMAALHVAREAIQAARWGPAELRDAALVVGTSRGNAAGWLGPWPGRRPFRLMAASNTIHSEPAAAISIEFGMAGPNQVLASGCAAGLDAVGVAWMMIRSGMAPRALAVAVDLPLVPVLLDNYAQSGLLAERFAPDPYHPASAGFVPGEGAAAMVIEPAAAAGGGGVELLHYGCNADACDPVGIPADGGRTPELLQAALGLHPAPVALCPHATGTAVQATAEPAAMRRAFGAGLPSLHLLKPYTGHTIGASGLLESVLLAGFLQDGRLPPNPPGLHAPPGFTLPECELELSGIAGKLSHGMGGHNALILLGVI
jgi:3-oxoacyl-(acyl-carrier-protein) synthase